VVGGDSSPADHERRIAGARAARQRRCARSSRILFRFRSRSLSRRQLVDRTEDLRSRDRARARARGWCGMRRQSGIIVPLFSLTSRNGWGIGEFGDLPMFARWLSEAGQSIIQILPIQEMPPIETSPYSAMTAMAIDPIYITMSNVPDFAGLGAELAMDGAEQ